MKLSKESKVLIGTLLISLVLISIGVVSQDIGVLGNFIIISTFVVATPQLLARYKKYREMKEMEEKFPLFLRDLIESIRSGMSFHKAIVAASKMEYGKLTKEIRKMANQITWGMPVEKVLNQFAERVKKSKRLFTAIKTIRESFLSGGDVVSTLDSVADNSNILEEARKERSSTLSQYVLLMYAISFIFIAIVVAINKLLIPVFQTTGGMTGETLGLTNPCLNCFGPTCSICTIFESTSQYLFSIEPNTIASYYTSLFFFMAVVQSFFSGLIAGQISENSIIAGIKHSLILVGVTFGAFSILVRLGLMVV